MQSLRNTLVDYIKLSLNTNYIFSFEVGKFFVSKPPSSECNMSRSYAVIKDLI